MGYTPDIKSKGVDEVEHYGLIISTVAEANHIMQIMKEYLPSYNITKIYDNIYRYETKNKRIFVSISGIGINNAIIAASRLREWFFCDKLYNIGICACIKGNYNIGDVVEFDKSIINYSFKYKPELYHYDDAGLNSGVWDENGLLITCQEETNQDMIYNDILLSRINNVYLDMEGYGVASFCSLRALKFKIIKIVSAKEIEDDFTILGQDSVLYKKLGPVLNEIITGEK